MPPTTVPSASRTSTCEGQPLLDGVLAALDRAEGLLDRLGLGLGEEADPAEVDAHQRGVGVAGQLGGAQEGAVAAEDHDDLGVAGGVGVGGHDLGVGDVEVGGLVLEQPDDDAAGRQPRRGACGPARRCRAGRCAR